MCVHAMHLARDLWHQLLCRCHALHNAPPGGPPTRWVLAPSKRFKIESEFKIEREVFKPHFMVRFLKPRLPHSVLHSLLRSCELIQLLFMDTMRKSAPSGNLAPNTTWRSWAPDVWKTELLVYIHPLLWSSKPRSFSKPKCGFTDGSLQGSCPKRSMGRTAPRSVLCSVLRWCSSKAWAPPATHMCHLIMQDISSAKQ